MSLFQDLITEAHDVIDSAKEEVAKVESFTAEEAAKAKDEIAALKAKLDALVPQITVK